jgi:hypothetical protein
MVDGEHYWVMKVFEKLLKGIFFPSKNYTYANSDNILYYFPLFK